MAACGVGKDHNHLFRDYLGTSLVEMTEIEEDKVDLVGLIVGNSTNRWLIDTNCSNCTSSMYILVN